MVGELAERLPDTAAKIRDRCVFFWRWKWYAWSIEHATLLHDICSCERDSDLIRISRELDWTNPESIWIESGFMWTRLYTPLRPWLFTYCDIQPRKRVRERQWLWGLPIGEGNGSAANKIRRIARQSAQICKLSLSTALLDIHSTLRLLPSLLHYHRTLPPSLPRVPPLSWHSLGASSVGERRRALADAGVRKISIRASQASVPPIRLFESVMWLVGVFLLEPDS